MNHFAFTNNTSVAPMPYLLDAIRYLLLLGRYVQGTGIEVRLQPATHVDEMRGLKAFQYLRVAVSRQLLELTKRNDHSKSITASTVLRQAKIRPHSWEGATVFERPLVLKSNPSSLRAA
uniref:Uncharacterized protein n=1 Tax=Anopheles dirus TaxID=7168 RepID=A0A182NVJ2_9DIPT